MPYYNFESPDNISETISKRNPSNEDFDDLSYSYSCIQAFHENQKIVQTLGNITKLKNDTIVENNPKLFTTSGDRENPIFQPFYTSNNCNQTDINSKKISKNTDFETNRSKPTQTSVKIKYKKINSETNRSVLTQTDFETEYPKVSYREQSVNDVIVLLQRLKFHFKNLSTMWPFSKTGDDFFSRFFKKNQQSLKIELLLKNITPNKKETIKQFIYSLKLNIEERTNLQNEKVFEIDITPLLADTNRLHNFLNFLRDTEFNVSKSAEKCDQNNNLANENVSPREHLSRQNESLNYFESNKIHSKNCDGKNINYSCNQGIAGNTNLSHNEIKEVIFETDNKYTDKPNTLSLDKNYRFLENSEITQEVIRSTVTKNSNTLKEDKFTNSTLKKDMVKKLVICSKRSKENMENDLTKLEKGDFGKTLKNNLCKCSIHNKQGDFDIYGDQCLFGKGDEFNTNYKVLITTTQEKGIPIVNANSEHIEYRNESKEIEDISILNQKTRKPILVKPKDFLKEFQTNKSQCQQRYQNSNGKIHKDLCSTEETNDSCNIKHCNTMNKNCVCGSNPANENYYNQVCFYGCFDSSCTEIASSNSNSSKRSTKFKIKYAGNHKEIILNGSLPSTTESSNTHSAGSCEKCNKNSSSGPRLRCLYKNEKSTPFSEDLTEIVFNHLKDNKIRTFLKSNLQVDSNNPRNIDVVMKNAEELKSKAVYLNKRLEELNEKKENIVTYREQTRNCLQRNKSKQGVFTKMHLLIGPESNVNNTYSRTAAVNGECSNSEKHNVEPKSIYKSVSSVFKFNKRRNEEIVKTRNARLSKLRFRSLDFGGQNVLNSSEDPNMLVNQYLINNNQKVRNKYSYASNNFSQDSNNVETLCEELRNQREEINTMKMLLNKCLNKDLMG